ncbi:hypothetical protein LY76DRAFT_380600 [Colletotrichum caudatum]|nr:hypothetical protein LY76DRAFT_380600 [Colletotrichum caudatum]
MTRPRTKRQDLQSGINRCQACSSLLTVMRHVQTSRHSCDDSIAEQKSGARFTSSVPGSRLSSLPATILRRPPPSARSGIVFVRDAMRKARPGASINVGNARH